MQMESESLVREHLRDYAPASNLLHNERIKNLMAAGHDVFHFGFGQSPFPVMESAVAGLRKHAGENSYLPVAGIPELRAEIADFHSRYDSLNFEPDDIIVGPGSKELIFLTLQVFRGDIMVISPSWTTYKPQILLSNHTPHIVYTSYDRNWKITPEMINKFIEATDMHEQKLLIFNNPDNPTGASYSEAELLALSKVFREHKLIVLTDEIYARLRYDQNHISIAKFYPEGTILSAGLSKWASAGGWRLGYHIFPKELLELKNAVRSAASHTYTTAPAPVQHAAVEMFRDKAGCHNYIQHTARIMSATGQFCHRELSSVGVRVAKPTAGYYIFPDFEVVHNKLRQRGIETCQQMCDAMFEEAAVSVMAGGPAFLRPVEELTTRLCFVNFDGSSALAESRRLGLNIPLPENFVEEQCRPVYDGIMALKNWVSQQLDS